MKRSRKPRVRLSDHLAADAFEDSVNVYESDHCAECSIDCDCNRFGYVQPLAGGEPRLVCLDCGRPAE